MHFRILAPLMKIKSSTPLVKFRLWIPLMKIKSWFPLVSPLPIATAPLRLLMKWVHIVRLLLRIEGAQVIGESPNGNSRLRLRKDCALGAKGTILEIPKDHVIFESVRQFGSWELDESKFLAAGLTNIAKTQRNTGESTVLLDIGANSGLVALQAINLAKTSNSLFLFEPVPQYAQAIQKNLSGLPRVEICNFALSDRNDDALMYTEAANHGNTSLYENTVPAINRVKQTIRLVDTAEYFRTNLASFDRYVLKCDTQGMDALILSRVPESVWQKVEAAIIEVTALPQIDVDHVNALLNKLSGFQYVSWHAKKREKMDISEIREFWLSKSERHKNLYLWRSA
ncbi:MAG: FkbM family methyltransferase [Actinobacteria bacterium]|nr:FkbM family methyltransferase [Actinomycetota bacterium]